MHACHPCAWDGEAGEAGVPGQPWVHSLILSQLKKKKKSMLELTFVFPTHYWVTV